jgi:murein DD-endopeptidase MepM/ murein hydrolase activator NlpD
MFIFGFNTGFVSAQTNHAKTLNYPFYSQFATQQCGTILAGSDNEEKVYNYLLGKGLTAIQAAGAMGNLKYEGGFNPKRVEGGHMEGDRWVNQSPLQFPREMDTMPPSNLAPIVSGKYAGQPGYGIVQWTSPGRKQGLSTMAQEKSLPVHDLGLQLDYMWSELEGSYKARALDPLRAATDLAVAVSIWQNQYEVGAHFEPRLKAAQDYLVRYGSRGAAATASDSVTCAGGSGEVVGGFSLPLDRKWYDQHQEWFTKPHHDYPAADIPVPTGTPVYSMTGGKVLKAPVGGDCGTGIIIDAGNGVQFMYCHGSDGGSVPSAQVGDTVVAGQLIMHSANTGNSEGPHLHVEITLGGSNRCPQSLFTGIATGSIPNISLLPTSGCTN